MRFALIATSVAAVIAIPLAAGALAPHMSSEEFVSAVRCTAYEDATAPNSNVDVAKFRLNGEAARQPEEAVAKAHKAASDVAHAAVESDNGQQLAQACPSPTQRDV